MAVEDYTELAVALLGGGALATIVNKMLTRKIDGATIEQLKAETQALAIKTANETAHTQVEIMRSVNQEMRQAYEARIAEMSKEKSADVAELAIQRERITALTSRVFKLEERERHMLTRAAVHEAWDQMAFQMLRTIDPYHPEPPPLIHVELPHQKTGDDNGES